MYQFLSINTISFGEAGTSKRWPYVLLVLKGNKFDIEVLLLFSLHIENFQGYEQLISILVHTSFQI